MAHSNKFTSRSKAAVLSGIAIAAALALAGCSDSSGTSGSSSAAAPAANSASAAAFAKLPAVAESESTTIPVKLADITAATKGFPVGNPMSARATYVFFDPQCPHCADLWKASQPLLKQARFVWVPVTLLNRASLTQGAALLSAQDPAKAMAEHEESMQARRGGITASSDVPDNIKQALELNSEVMKKLGARGVPFVVAGNGETSRVLRGGTSTVGLAAFLGIRFSPEAAQEGASEAVAP